MPTVTKTDIINGLKKLGLKPGDLVLVHSALSSLGKVEGGADAVIDALLETIGPSGTLMMPTICFGLFDKKNSPSSVGIITEQFRLRPDSKRSIHPSHSVAVQGPLAKTLIKDNATAATATGKGTPFGRLAEHGGYVLLLGVDQDRSTLLHSYEDYADAPYLNVFTGSYIDEDGTTKTREYPRFPGPHRDFIGVEPKLREAGIITYGRIGNAVCRLMKADALERVIMQELDKDIALYLCDNPACIECLIQRGDIKHAYLGNERYIYTAPMEQLTDDLNAAVLAYRSVGIYDLQLGPRIEGKVLVDCTRGELKEFCELRKRKIAIIDSGVGRSYFHEMTKGEYDNFAQWLDLAQNLGVSDLTFNAMRIDETKWDESKETYIGMLKKLAQLAERADITISLENQKGTMADSSAHVVELLKRVNSPNLMTAFNPAEYVRLGEWAFRGAYIKTSIKRFVRILYINDALFSDGSPQLPGLGNVEMKELISIVNCRSFDGFMSLKPGWPGDLDKFRAADSAHTRLLETL